MEPVIVVEARKHYALYARGVNVGVTLTTLLFAAIAGAAFYFGLIRIGWPGLI